MSKQIVCFGELLLRLAAPERQLLLQSPRLEVQVGGAEANVAVSLARFGHAAAMVSLVPQHALGEAALGELRRHGVDVTGVARGNGRMGLYFVAPGALQRPSEVIYDRAHSLFADAPADYFNWDALLAHADAFHISGVTPALGATSAAAALRAMRAARARGLFVAFDGNYRAKLWETWQGDAAGIVRGLMAEADIVFADHRDIAIALDWRAPNGDTETMAAAAAQAAFAAFPRLGRLATTIRVQHSVDHHSLAALLITRQGLIHRAGPYPLQGIVDRIGAGDAFAAGMLHGLRSGMDDGASLHFALAAAALKHSIPGDFNLVGADEVNALVAHGRFDVRR